MVAAGMGVTLVPRLSVPARRWPGANAARTKTRSSATCRSVDAHGGCAAHAPRGAGLAAQFHALRGDRRLRNAIYACELPGVSRLS
jgi:LysR family hydrogen peroxide-inducible transcriptional activator